MYAPVGLHNYDGMGLNGFGMSSMDTVQQINKALNAGYQTVNQTNGGALRVESLEESLKVLEHTDRHIRFWRDLPKSPAFNTVEEYNTLESYGDNSFGPFTREGEIPLENDSQLRRRTALIKYMGCTRAVTHPATMVAPAHGDLIALENANGILWLLRQIEISLFRGNSRLAPLGQEGEQWDGLTNLIFEENFIDLEGSPMQEADLEEVANLLAFNYADPTDIYTGYRPLSDLVKTMYPRHRVNLPAPAEGRIGQSLNAFESQAGILKFNATRFIERPPVAPDGIRGPATLVPTAPSAIAVSKVAGTGVGEFDKSQGDDNARYAYLVTAANRFGESSPVAVTLLASGLSPIITSAEAEAGYEVNLSITNAVSLAVPPDYFNVYRTAALPEGTSDAQAIALPRSAFSLIQQVPAESQASGGVTPAVAGTLKDINRVMPFTEEVYVGELSPQVITFRQLAPIMKMDLAVTGPSYRWMILLYGVLLLFARKKWAKLTNVGRLGL